ncbi:MAG TPA: sulfotransferase [Solirubrobacteraceae bacterium]|jgi:hypothetical protein|nr:sulfotransferase [Solirubrobacteraceae bacterium]
MTLPTFFIVGAAKAGTTSLHYYLDQHPQIQMSSVKEPHFFGGPENEYPYPVGRVSRLDAYEKLFDPAMGVRGEASPGYANHPRRQGVPQRIKELVPDAKFIYLVRDPVARTVSHHQHRVAVEGERRSLQDALGDLSDPCSPCVCPSMYALQVERYLDHFPQERILVLDQTELLADRRSTLGQIFDFLSVDSFDCERFDDELYKSSERRVYPPGYARFVERAILRRIEWVPSEVRSSLRRTAERVLPRVQAPTLDEQTRMRLQEHYAGDVERLRALTGKRFSTWSV